ncbi:hypothetical protein [Streptomyces sp. 8L]|uniref:hypothetical protein n=1 Tax=Streptomyces sp. 8L TaxID=2877242 RepID=UPI001CD6F497|nr:hypothetical protein [Streptomyces sp. 8L]MCA1220214.1 hypothetical protein [Streptomyces sp. 8L]
MSWIKERVPSSVLGEYRFESAVRAWGDLARSDALAPHEIDVIAELTKTTSMEVTHAYKRDNLNEREKAKRLVKEEGLTEIDAHLDRVAQNIEFDGFY